MRTLGKESPQVLRWYPWTMLSTRFADLPKWQRTFQIIKWLVTCSGTRVCTSMQRSLTNGLGARIPVAKQDEVNSKLARNPVNSFGSRNQRLYCA